jgi:hypothetical protein
MAVTNVPTPLNLFPVAYRPYSNITPFTYRDGLTYLEVLEALRCYIRDVLVPHVDTEISELTSSWQENLDSLEANWETSTATLKTFVNDSVSTLTTFVNDSIATDHTWTTDQIAAMQAEVDAAVQEVVNSSIVLQDPVLSQILADPTKQSRITLDGIFDTELAPYAKTADLTIYAQKGVDTDFVNGVKDRGQRLLGQREAAVTPYQYGAVPPIVGSDNTAAISAMFTAVSSATSKPDIYFPTGSWFVKASLLASLALSSGMKIRGAGKAATKLIFSGTTMPGFSWSTNLSNMCFSDMTIQSDNDIFAITGAGGIYGSKFDSLFLYCSSDSKRIWNQDSTGSFVHNTFSNVEMQRTTNSIVAPFYIRNNVEGTAINFNLFQQVRLNGYNNVITPFIYIETTSSQAYSTDWTFINILGEQNPGGMIHSKGSRNWLFMNVTDEDSNTPYVDNMIACYATTGVLAPSDNTFINVGRRGQSVAAGKFDIYHDVGGPCTIINGRSFPGIMKINAGPRFTVIATAGFPTQYSGTGTPENIINAARGSTYSRLDGGAGTSFYVKETDATLYTGWVAK